MLGVKFAFPGLKRIATSQDHPLLPTTAVPLRYRTAWTRKSYATIAIEDGTEFWRSIPVWRDVNQTTFLRYQWQTANSIERSSSLLAFLEEVLPQQRLSSRHETPKDFVEDVRKALKYAPMATRLTPYILSCIDWSNPLNDPLRRQFIPLSSESVPDHPKLQLDSLHETEDSPVQGLVHRYPDKALFLASSVCPVYCRFCTRSYSVGSETETHKKKRFLPIWRRWDKVFAYLEEHPVIQDIVISGGDSFFLDPDDIRRIGKRLLEIPHIRRIRYASKGLAICPVRFLDPEDQWMGALVEVSDFGRSIGKSVAMHTHFNHPNEISWLSKLAAQRLFERGVTVRNQSVLLKGVNNDLQTMQTLIRRLADMNIQPYYVYQGDMVKGVEDLRTPLKEILALESNIRGTIAGFMTPQFVVDLPGGGGKRLAMSYETYDEETGVSRFLAPGIKSGKTVYEYWDPVKRN